MPTQTSRTTHTTTHTMTITAAEFREKFGVPKLAAISLETPGTPGSYEDSAAVSSISTFKITWTETTYDP